MSLAVIERPTVVTVDDLGWPVMTPDETDTTPTDLGSPEEGRPLGRPQPELGGDAHPDPARAQRVPERLPLREVEGVGERADDPGQLDGACLHRDDPGGPDDEHQDRA